MSIRFHPSCGAAAEWEGRERSELGWVVLTNGGQEKSVCGVGLLVHGDVMARTKPPTHVRRI